MPGRCGDPNVSESYGRKLKTGDVVEVRVQYDTETKGDSLAPGHDRAPFTFVTTCLADSTLSFHVNGDSLGTAFEGLNGYTRAAVCDSAAATVDEAPFVCCRPFKGVLGSWCNVDNELRMSLITPWEAQVRTVPLLVVPVFRLALLGVCVIAVGVCVPGQVKIAQALSKSR